MNFLRRCGTILAGHFAAATAAFMVPAGFFFFGFPDSISLSDTPDAIRGVAFLMLLVGGSLLVPTLFVIAISETLRTRNMFAYLTLGAVVAVALTIFTIGLSNAGNLFHLKVSVVTGVVAGFIYWRMLAAMRANGGPLNEPHRTPNDHLHARDRLTLLDPAGQASWSAAATSCAWRCSPILILRPNEKAAAGLRLATGS